MQSLRFERLSDSEDDGRGTHVAGDDLAAGRAVCSNPFALAWNRATLPYRLCDTCQGVGVAEGRTKSCSDGIITLGELVHAL